MATTPTPTPTSTKMEAKEEAEEIESGAGAESTPGTSGEFIEKPIHISVVGKTKMYKCGNCDITPPPNDPEWVWIPISVLSTQRRP